MDSSIEGYLVVIPCGFSAQAASNGAGVLIWRVCRRSGVVIVSDVSSNRHSSLLMDCESIWS
jgi:hypothetical protein